MPQRVRFVQGFVAFPIALLALGYLDAARADAWLDAGDSALRHHLQYLVDTNVIEIPLTAWPIPSTDVAEAVARAGNDSLTVAQTRSLAYVSQRISRLSSESTRLAAHASGAARPILLRTFEDTPREEGEAGVALSAAGSRFSARLAVALVADPGDHQRVRLDDTHGSVRLGNWLLTAGALDRWWGPGWQGSLILSNNARPVPALALDRESSRAFESPWLRWIGPWRFTTFMGHMESERADRDHPLLFGMRLTLRPFSEISIGDFRPFAGVEFAMERTAQWCAEGLPCSTQAFVDVLTGDDSLGDTVDLEDEPGNQLAGWTLRWASPFRRFPVAIYRQRTGESIHSDELALGQSLTLTGIELWGGLSSGSTWRINAEYAATACGEPKQDPFFDCAYTNHLFPVEGYRYRGRALGHSMDGDGRMYSIGLHFAAPDGWDARLVARRAEINWGGIVPDPVHTISNRPIDVAGLQSIITMDTSRGFWRVGLGVDEAEEVASGRKERTAYGFAEWRVMF